VCGEVNRVDVIPAILGKLQLFLGWFRTQTSLRLFATSLLLVYEGAPANHPDKPAPPVDIRLVDFAHTYESVSSEGETDNNTLYGLENFEQCLSFILKNPRYQAEGRECILIGHAGHPEVEGTLGQYRSINGAGAMYLVESVEDVERLEVKRPEFLAFVTQTTLSVDDTAEVIDVLRRRFPEIVGPKKEDICYATQNRQDAVKKLTGDCDLILVVGSPNSSNSTRLMELSQKKGVPAYLIDNVSEIQREWLEGKSNIGLTAGASAPEVLVEEVIEKLKMWGVDSVVEAPGIQESVVFSLPRELYAGTTRSEQA
jgi:hypothetical protein